MAFDASSKKLLKKFGLRMRELREKHGWTLEYAEERGYPSWNHLQKVEAGKKNVSLTTIARLSKLYRISISDLFKGL